MNAEELKALPILAPFTPAELEVLAMVLTVQELGPHRQLFKAGDRALSCLIVLDGEVDVELEVDGQGRQVLATVGQGELIGEVAVLDGGRRSATCVAGPKGARLARLAKDDFDHIFHAGNVMAFKLTQLIVSRLVQNLRRASARLVETVERERP